MDMPEELKALLKLMGIDPETVVGINVEGLDIQAALQDAMDDDSDVEEATQKDITEAMWSNSIKMPLWGDGVREEHGEQWKGYTNWIMTQNYPAPCGHWACGVRWFS